MPFRKQYPRQNVLDAKARALGRLYDESYYASHCGEPYHRGYPGWAGFFDGIADVIESEFAPRTVLDAGCAIGFLVESLRERGIEAYGIDVSEYAIAQVPEHIRPYCSVCSITEELPRDYDLIVCIEVLEHLPADQAEPAIANLAAHTDNILFSSTPHDFTEPTHLNVQPADYWVRLFARYGFSPSTDLSADFIAPHAILFSRAGQAAAGAEEPRRVRASAAQRAGSERRAGHFVSMKPVRGKLAHGRILIRRTIEVLRSDGPLEVGRRAVCFFRKKPEQPGPPVGVPDIESRYQRWIGATEPNADELEEQRVAVSALRFRPTVSVVMAVFDPPFNVLYEAIDSVLGQTYGELELCVANAGSDPYCRALLRKVAERDGRVRVAELGANRGISANSNAALELARGEFVALMDHDDLLTPNALFAFVVALNERPDLDVLYSDEDRLRGDGKRVHPFLKPDWSPELLHSFMYVGHLTVYRRSLIESLGGFRPEYDGSQDYDLILRASAVTDRIQHVPQVLYHWRMIPSSAAAGAKAEARRSNVAALADAVGTRGLPADVLALPSSNRVVFSVEGRPLVSIVIPSDDLERATACVQAVRSATSYDRIELLVVTKSELADELEQRLTALTSFRCVRFDDPFNFARKCNRGAEQAHGEYLVFLNDDVEPLTEDWIETMLQYAQQADIGGVSPKLLYSDDTIQYAGLVTGVRDLVGTAFHTWPRHETTYNNMALSVRNVSCLTGACMMVRSEDFRAVGRWDAVNTPIDHSDFDLSFKLRDLGRRLVYTPFAELRHLGRQSIGTLDVSGDGPSEQARATGGADSYMLARWGTYMSYDPYFPNEMRRLVYTDESDYRVFAASTAVEPGWWRALRVVLISHDLTLSGAPTMLLEIGRFLKARGMLVTVMAPEQGGLLEQYAEAEIPVIVDPALLAEPLRSRSLLAGFDLIVANTLLGWRAVQAAKSLDKPCVWLVHESAFGLGKVLEHQPDASEAFRAADAVVFPSGETADLYRDLVGTSPSFAIHYGIADVADLAIPAPPFEREPGKLYVAHVGSLEPRKGADVLVESVRALPPELRERVKVFLVGRPLEADYAAWLEELAAGLDVEIVGETSRSVALGYVKHADLFVCSSREETGPVVVIEAMALGKAIVSTKVGAATEILRPGMDGYLIEVDDVAALTGHLTHLLRSPQELSALGAAARESYERNLTLDRYGDEILDILRRVVASNGSVGEPMLAVR